MKTPRLLVIAALGALAATIGPAQNAGPSPQATIIVSGELTREFQLGSGSSAEGQLVLRNTSATPGRARLYQVDYTLDAGAHVYGEAGQLARSNAAWIELGERQPELAPGETRIVPFKISVPSTPALSGTYWSMIMVEGLSPDTDNTRSNKISVQSVIRYGIQVITQIGGTAVAKPTISRQNIAVEKGQRFLCFDLANNGERWLQPKIEVRLFDHEGLPLAVLPSPKSRIYPGTTAPQRFDLSRFARGDYLALIVLDSDDELYGAQYRFHLDD